MDQKISYHWDAYCHPHINQRKFTQRTLNVIRRQVEAQPGIKSQEIKQKNPCLLARVAEQTVREYLKRDLDYRSCRLVPKPWVTCTHFVKRLAFDTQYKDWGLDEWSKVLWSDEPSFEVTDNQRGRVYRPHGSDP